MKLGKLIFLVAAVGMLLASPVWVDSAMAQQRRTTTAAKPVVPKIDVNSASREELMTLPGIDEETAQQIIEWRPFKNKKELKQTRVVVRGGQIQRIQIVSNATYAQIEKSIETKQPKVAGR